MSMAQSSRREGPGYSSSKETRKAERSEHRAFLSVLSSASIVEIPVVVSSLEQTNKASLEGVEQMAS